MDETDRWAGLRKLDVAAVDEEAIAVPAGELHPRMGAAQAV